LKTSDVLNLAALIQRAQAAEAARPKASRLTGQAARPGVWAHSGPGGPARPYRAPVRVRAAAGRNDPCPCASGQKFKNCCGRSTS
jgi:uncharacterized protein YecA (UPF0149 family)